MAEYEPGVLLKHYRDGIDAAFTTILAAMKYAGKESITYEELEASWEEYKAEART